MRATEYLQTLLGPRSACCQTAGGCLQCSSKPSPGLQPAAVERWVLLCPVPSEEDGASVHITERLAVPQHHRTPARTPKLAQHVNGVEDQPWGNVRLPAVSRAGHKHTVSEFL